LYRTLKEDIGFKICNDIDLFLGLLHVITLFAPHIRLHSYEGHVRWLFVVGIHHVKKKQGCLSERYILEYGGDYALQNVGNLLPTDAASNSTKTETSLTIY